MSTLPSPTFPGAQRFPTVAPDTTRHASTTDAHGHRTTLDPLSRAGGAGSLPLGGLSPEELLAWVQTRLEGYDASIRQLMEETGTARDRAAALQQFADELHGLDGQGDHAAINDVVRDIAEHCDDPSIVEYAKRILSTGEANTSKSELQALQQKLQSAASAITSSTDLIALRLQSLVSARGQAVQVASSILQSLNESAKQVINNLR